MANKLSSRELKTILILLNENKLTKNGKSKTSSTSKTKKISATRKNRKVNGKRALNLGENPHSKGLIFSRSKGSFLLNPTPAKVTKMARMNTNKIKFIKIKINGKLDI